MGAIFISYRRDDTSDFAKKLHKRLRLYYREEDIFLDVDDIPYAAKFPEELDQALKRTDIVLILIGPKWLAEGHSGNPRIQDSQDYVRMEIEHAIQAGKIVLPIVVGKDTQLPTLASLPESIAVFPQLQALWVTEDLPANQMNRILKAIYRYCTAPRRDYDPEQAKRLPPFLRYKPDTRLGLIIYIGILPSIVGSLLLPALVILAEINRNLIVNTVYNIIQVLTAILNLTLVAILLTTAIIYGITIKRKEKYKWGNGIIISSILFAYPSIFAPLLLLLPLFVYLLSNEDLKRKAPLAVTAGDEA